MICIGTTSAGERCKQYREPYCDHCKRHCKKHNHYKMESSSSEESFLESDLYDKLKHVEFKIPGREDLGVVNVKGDGFCFWRSLSLCLFGHEEKYFRLSEKCIREKSHDDIVNYQWVEFQEIPIISRILKITINVVHYIEDGIYLYICLPSGEIENKSYPCDIDPTRTNVYIYYIPGHYTSIVRI